MVHYLGKLVNSNLTIIAIDSYAHGVMYRYIFMMIHVKISTDI